MSLKPLNQKNRNGPAEIRTQDLRRVKALFNQCDLKSQLTSNSCIFNPLTSNLFAINSFNRIYESINCDKNFNNYEFDENLEMSDKDKSLNLKTSMSMKLNDVWNKCKSKFQEWLWRKKITEHTKREYLSALLRFFENKIINKPIEFRDLSLKDKEERGLRNLFNYFEDEELDEICGYSLEKWRRFVKIKKSGVVEIYINDQEIKEAYEACPDDLKSIYRLLVYSGNRFSHIHEMLKKFDERNIIIDGEVVHYPTSSCPKVQNKHFICFSLLHMSPNLRI